MAFAGILRADEHEVMYCFLLSGAVGALGRTSVLECKCIDGSTFNSGVYLVISVRAGNIYLESSSKHIVLLFTPLFRNSP